MSVELHWSRVPGRFLDRNDGTSLFGDDSQDAGSSFDGTVREWYETIIEAVHDVVVESGHCWYCDSINVRMSSHVVRIFETSLAFRPNHETPSPVGTLRPNVIITCDHAVDDDVVEVNMEGRGLDGRRKQHSGTLRVHDLNPCA